jgi:uncharacterized protein (DUF362 family)
MNRRFFLLCITGFAAYLAGIFSFSFNRCRRIAQWFSRTPFGSCTTACAETGGKSRVVQIRNNAVFTTEKTVDITIALEMLTAAMLHLTGTSTPDRAWKTLFKPDDVVGIKVNALGGRQIATHPGVVDAVIAGLTTAGIPEENIIVWDRLTGELEKAGYTINTSDSGVKCFGTDKRYDPEPEIIGSIGSCFSSILSSRCTALINIPVLKDHDLSGVSLSLKNFYGAIHNPNKYHDNNCDPYIADLNTHTYIKDKLRLVVCDGLSMQYQGGPSYKPQWSSSYCTLLLSRDPVAIDRIATILIEDERRKRGLPTLKDAAREPIHIATAARNGLGTDNLNSIELVTAS